MPSVLQPLLFFFSDDPALRLLQLLLLIAGLLVVFLVFFTLRDVLLRTNSFWLQLLSIILVAFLPLIGFLLYILIRPAMTLRQREEEKLVREIHAHLMKNAKADKPEAPKPADKSKKPTSSDKR